MVGTGFDENIKNKLYELFDSCFNGLMEQVYEKNLSPVKGLNLELEEIKQYTQLINETNNSNSKIILGLFQLLKPIYEDLLKDIEITKELKTSIENQRKILDKYIDEIEIKQKETYGSIWEQ